MLEHSWCKPRNRKEFRYPDSNSAGGYGSLAVIPDAQADTMDPQSKLARETSRITEFGLTPSDKSMDVLTLYEKKKDRPSTTFSKEIKSFLLAAMRGS